MCLDTEGFRDNNENDGDVKDEKLTGQNDADIVWKFDMMEEVGTFPHATRHAEPASVCAGVAAPPMGARASN